MLRRAALLLIVLGLTGLLGGSGLAWFSIHQGQNPAETTVATSAFVLEGNTRGRIAFPDQGKSYLVVEGATQKNLLRGPGHVANSAVPGTSGNAIIAAHRDTHFRVLKHLKLGQEITVEENGQTSRYVVTILQIVKPTDNLFYQPTSKAVLTLVTCYPFTYIGPAPQRFIVRAELMDPAS